MALFDVSITHYLTNRYHHLNKGSTNPGHKAGSRGLWSQNCFCALLTLNRDTARQSRCCFPSRAHVLLYRSGRLQYANVVRNHILLPMQFLRANIRALLAKKHSTKIKENNKYHPDRQRSMKHKDCAPVIKTPFAFASHQNVMSQRLFDLQQEITQIAAATVQTPSGATSPQLRSLASLLKTFTQARESLSACRYFSFPTTSAIHDPDCKTPRTRTVDPTPSKRTGGTEQAGVSCS